jgi:hypothetical protein
MNETPHTRWLQLISTKQYKQCQLTTGGPRCDGMSKGSYPVWCTQQRPMQGVTQYRYGWSAESRFRIGSVDDIQAVQTIPGIPLFPSPLFTCYWITAWFKWCQHRLLSSPIAGVGFLGAASGKRLLLSCVSRRWNWFIYIILYIGWLIHSRFTLLHHCYIGIGNPRGMWQRRGKIKWWHEIQGTVSNSLARSLLWHWDLCQISYHIVRRVCLGPLVSYILSISFVRTQALAHIPGHHQCPTRHLSTTSKTSKIVIVSALGTARVTYVSCITNCGCNRVDATNRGLWNHV